MQRENERRKRVRPLFFRAFVFRATIWSARPGAVARG